MTAGILLAALCLANSNDVRLVPPQEIERAVRELGHPELATRERASETLWKAGPAAEDAVAAAAESDDPEVRRRARRLHERFRFGHYADTPDDVVRLIDQFRQGDVPARATLISKFVELGALETLQKLAEVEKDERWHRALASTFHTRAGRIAPLLLTRGQTGKAEEILRTALRFENPDQRDPDTALRHYAAYLLLSAGLEDAIAEAERDWERKRKPRTARWLVYQHRAQGELKPALEFARRAGDEALVDAVLVEMADWTTLAQRLAGREPADLEATLRLAAFYHFAEQEQDFARVAEAIRQHARDEPKMAHLCARAFILCDRPQEGIDLCLEPVNGEPPAEWLARALMFAQGRCREVERIASAHQLYSLGQIERAREQARRYASELPAEEVKHGSHLRTSAQLAFELGMESEGVEYAAKLLGWLERTRAKTSNRGAPLYQSSHWSDENWMSCLVAEPGRGASVRSYERAQEWIALANNWWAALRPRAPEQSYEAAVRRLRRVMAALREPHSRRDEVLEAIADSESLVERLKAHEQPLALEAFAESCVIIEDFERAEQFFVRAVEAASAETFPRESSRHLFDPQTDHRTRQGVTRLRRVGDFFSDRGRWAEAAEWYRRACEFDALDALSRYLLGLALQRSGAEEEGKRETRLADLLPLADGDRRYHFAQGLERRGLKGAALRQRELLMKTVGFIEWQPGYVAGQVASDIADTDPFRAVELWRRNVLPALDSGILSDLVDLLRVPHTLHRVRARGLLARGEMEAALESIRKAQAALPAEIGLAVDLVPRLERAGATAEADRLFEQVFNANARVCRDFPRAVEYYHRVARLCLACERRPRDGLRFAEKAVELAPENPGYSRTLRELEKVAAADGDSIDQVIEISQPAGSR